MASSRSAPKTRRSRLLGDLVTLGGLAALLFAVSFLPPDTSLAEVQRAGVLKACVPTQYPPLVTGDAAAPGFDVELLTEIAKRFDVRLALNVNTAMGRDFNPRNWRLTRAQCQIVAGGVVASTTTRSFLDTVDTGIETGWAIVRNDEAPVGGGATVGIYVGLSGLDRLALSGYLRRSGVRVQLVPTREALAAGLTAESYDAGIAESTGLRDLLQAHPDWNVAWLPGSLGRNPLALGLWKGDLTLKRKLVAVLDDLQRDGFVETLKARYGIAELDAVVDFQPPESQP